ncbi:hypothetical protein [Micromonospora echinofusca]|uniref:Uncharacterized protein n=1 Tax=Micromonospora echinofusca TaxID=47858 RepID=A0ABS3VIV8_MICEH|nr:hypothetical protein [Micromonospora echinofusca]MBO4204403.1 hypothetical protein [Micromonospora echinofusca]
MNTTPSWLRRRTTLAGLVAAGVLTLGCAVGGDVVAYDLPAEPARYTFEAETNGGRTVWEYTSARPSGTDVPELQPCMGEALGADGDCRPEPLIFLRYDLGLGLDDTARAGGTHRITVTGYYQERLSAPPEVTTMRVEVSFDGGGTWQPVTTRAAGRNTFTATLTHPHRDRAVDGVGLRVSATDSAGNTVTQTLPTAYTLR